MKYCASRPLTWLLLQHYRKQNLKFVISYSSVTQVPPSMSCTLKESEPWRWSCSLASVALACRWHVLRKHLTFLCLTTITPRLREDAPARGCAYEINRHHRMAETSRTSSWSRAHANTQYQLYPQQYQVCSDLFYLTAPATR